MGSVNYTYLSPGQSLGAGDERALFLKLFSGEVITKFEQSTIMSDKIMQKTISKGKSYQWPATGSVVASYHTPGTEMTGQATQQAEVTVGIDAVLKVDLFHDDFYETMSHYDTRAPYAYQAGEQLALAADISAMKEVIKGARSAATIPGVTNGGTQVINDKFKIAASPGAADNNERAAALFEGLFALAEAWDNKFIPRGRRYFALRPMHYYSLLKAIQSNGFSLSNADFMMDRADLNNISLPKVAGFQILMNVNVPSTDTSGTDSYHGVDASKTIGIAWTPEAIGGLTLMGLQTQSQYLVTRLGTFTVTYFAKGFGVLRPDCCGELILNTLSN